MLSLTGDRLLFIGMVFVAGFLLVQGFLTPVFGENRHVRRRLERRLREVASDRERLRPAALLRGRRELAGSGVERWLQRLPGMPRLALALDQAGVAAEPHRFVLLALAAGVAVAVAVQLALHTPLLTLTVAIVAGVLPFVHVQLRRAQRIARFEEQLQDALAVMVRALRAGHPFSEAVRLVGDDMPAPLGREFAITFADINYGGDVRRAVNGLLVRVPSVMVMAVVTAVLVQRETGGNLAEILEKIAAVIRSRFRFQRRVRTMAAEARLSAWILTMTPFVLFVAISVTQPDYLPMLTNDPMGRDLIGVAFGMIVVGALWMRHIMRIRV